MFSSSLLVVPQEEVRHDVGAPYLQRQAARVYPVDLYAVVQRGRRDVEFPLKATGAQE